ncbi:MAG: TIGR04348 family glycosyltransferase [Gemmataceae bacterium]|nr:TIGR04348 family glycosyltransferase [Gemmataceae bacterium]
MACPAPPHSRKGNRVTAERWARFLRGVGHRVTIGQEYQGEPCDLLIALHARRSYPAVRAFRKLHPDRPLIVALTGTDLYRDLPRSRPALRSLELADRLVVLQAHALEDLPTGMKRKARVILQSAEPVASPPPKSRTTFEVCVLGHLRHEKDPFRTALALRLLPESSRVRVTHAGAALSRALAERARKLMERDPRYRWVGEVPRGQARRLLARSHLLVLSSIMEGGANVISEALVAGVPVVASRILGTIGLLGARYPGYFPLRNTQALVRLLNRAATDEDFYRKLTDWCNALAPQFEPARERQAWQTLLAELAPDSAVLESAG